MITSRIPVLLFLVFIFACNTRKASQDIQPLAEKYVRLGLTIGNYDSDFVDAYYGPDSLKPAAKYDSTVMVPVDSLLGAV